MHLTVPNFYLELIECRAMLHCCLLASLCFRNRVAKESLMQEMCQISKFINFTLLSRFNFLHI